jgi:hypothetical protein
MRTLKTLALVLPLTLCGCLLTTGQIAIDYDLGTINVTDSDNLVAEQVDLNTIEDYTEHKDELTGVSDMALLGTITNNLGATSKLPVLGGGDPTLHLEAWITAATTNYTTEAQVRANAIKLWGPLVVPPGETVQIDWNDSAALFTPYGKGTLINEMKGDGVFTIYLVGTSGFYNFTVENTTLVLTMEAEQ